jgi:hypothetical protein
MTPAAISSYLHLWQLPVIMLYLLAWVVGGPYLTRWILRKTALPRHKTGMVHAARINFLGNGSALLALGTVTGSLAVLGQRLGYPHFYLLAAVVGPAVMLVMSWAVHWVMLEVPGREVLRIITRTTVPLLALGALLGVATGVPTWYLRRAELKRQGCRENLLRLHSLLHSYEQQNPGQEAPTLEALLKNPDARKEWFHCAGRTGPEPSYLYAPAPTLEGNLSQQVRVCDRRGNHGRARLVLFTDGRVEEFSEAEFARLMQEPLNRQMAGLVAAER